MPLSPRPSSKAISTVVDDRSDPTLPVILEFQMPSTAITTAPVPGAARHVPEPGFADLATAIATEAGAPGWCGLAGDGALTVQWLLPEPPLRPLPVTVSRKGRRRSPGPIIPIAITAPDGRHLLGSPINVRAITATVGCVSTRDGGLSGWAWHPGNPNVDPVLAIRPIGGKRELMLPRAS